MSLLWKLPWQRYVGAGIVLVCVCYSRGNEASWCWAVGVFGNQPSVGSSYTASAAPSLEGFADAPTHTHVRADINHHIKEHIQEKIHFHFKANYFDPSIIHNSTSILQSQLLLFILVNVLSLLVWRNLCAQRIRWLFFRFNYECDCSCFWALLRNAGRWLRFWGEHCLHPQTVWIFLSKWIHLAPYSSKADSQNL